MSDVVGFFCGALLLVAAFQAGRFWALRGALAKAGTVNDAILAIMADLARIEADRPRREAGSGRSPKAG